MGKDKVFIQVHKILPPDSSITSSFIAGCDVFRLPGALGVDSPLTEGDVCFGKRFGPSSS
jgi:hypothetical protein